MLLLPLLFPLSVELAFRFGVDAEEGSFDFAAFFGAFVDSGVFEDVHEDGTDFLFQDIPAVFFREGRVFRQEFVDPVAVFYQFGVVVDVFAFYETVL